MQDIDWNIFQFVVAVADHGSAVAAAKVLGVDASTVQRRIIRFERDHGVTLFERQRSGYTPTTECAAIIDQARAMEAGVSETIRNILGQDLRLEGRVTVATNETLAETILPRHLVEFRRQNPAIEIDLNVSGKSVNLARLDADIAVRPSHNPPQNLKAQRVADLAVAVFASPSLGIEPAPLEALAKLGVTWVGVAGPLEVSTAFDVLHEFIPSENVIMRANTFTAMNQMVIAGAGLAVLPCCLPNAKDGLVRLTPPLAGRAVPLWVLTHPDVRHSARVKALAQHLHEGLIADKAVLEGSDREE